MGWPRTCSASSWATSRGGGTAGGEGPGQGEDLDSWLNAFNQQWVEAAGRISPALLVELINLAGLRFEEYVATLDLDATGVRVPWATGSDPPRSGSMSPASTWSGTCTSSRSARLPGALRSGLLS